MSPTTMTAPTAPRALSRQRRPAIPSGCGCRRHSFGSTLGTGMVSTDFAIASVANPRVERRVCEVDGQVGRDDHDDDDEVDTLDHGVVALDDRLHEELPHAREPEHRLDDDRPAGDLRDLEAEHRDDGDERVLEAVL